MTIIENVRVFQPEDVGMRDILLCHDKIVAIKENADGGPLLKDANRINGEGLMAVPGYIDQHVHITGGGGEGGFKNRVPELQLSDCIRAGITTVVGLLGTDGITRSVDNVLAKAKALNDEGLTAFCLTGSYGYPPVTVTGSLQKDIAFVQEIIGVKIAISDHRSSHITKEELIRLASDVRVASLISGKQGIITFHLGHGRGQLNMIFEILKETDLPISIFRPTHVQKVQDQAIEFAKLGGYIDYTAGSNSSRAADNIMEALKAGAPLERITVSSDANGSSPRWNDQHEIVGITAASTKNLFGLIRLLVQEEQLGMADALRLVTSNVAQALGIAGTKGYLKPGFDADLLLLNKDLKVDTVIARGQILMESGELKVKGTFED